MQAYFRLFREVFSANVASVLEYKIPFLLQFFGMMLNNAAFLVFWVVLLEKTGTIAGWGLKDVLFLWAVSPAAFGLAMIVFGNVNQLSTLIMEGDLDVYLLQPKDPLLHALISRTSTSAWGDLLYGFLLLPFVTLNPWDWLLFLGFVVTGALVFAAAFALVQTLAFWLGNISGLAGTAKEFLLTFTLYPETMFPQDFRWVFYTLVPAGFVAYLPHHVLLGRELGWLPVIAVAALGLVVLSWFVFRWGLRRYESGNSLAGRL